MIAGFERPTTGTISVFGKPIAGPSDDRGVVFQSELALFPWLTVEENVGFGLKMKRLAKAEIRDIVERQLETVNLLPHRAKFPREISDGMKQRVQIARALASNPDILLLDEPFGALDAQTRSRMQEELARIWESFRKTVVFITHDIGEAIWLGDRS
jgi:NitT/TauT family transport system ATP-binding protein